MSTKNVKGRLGGQAAPREPFRIGGTIRVAGPDFLGKVGRGEEVMIDEDESCVELFVQVENSEKEKILEADPWFSMDGADVEISAQDTKGSRPQDDVLNISFKGAGKRELSMVINSAQARALLEILTNYVRACDHWSALEKVYPVPATA